MTLNLPQIYEALQRGLQCASTPVIITYTAPDREFIRAAIKNIEDCVEYHSQQTKLKGSTNER